MGGGEVGGTTTDSFVGMPVGRLVGAFVGLNTGDFVGAGSPPPRKSFRWSFFFNPLFSLTKSSLPDFFSCFRETAEPGMVARKAT